MKFVSLFAGIGGFDVPKGVYPHTHIKPKTYPAEFIARVAEMYAQGMTQTEIAEQLGTSQKVVWRAMRRHGLTTRPQAKRDQEGPRNASWRGGLHINTAGYAFVRRPDHPRAGANGYVPQHVLVMEEHLGRRLVWRGPGHPESEIIHHLNGDKLDNRLENLIITTFAEHLDYHRDRATGRNGDGGDAKCH
jgi:hypothetical protein